MARRSDKAVKFSHAWLDGIPKQQTRREWADSECDCLVVRVGTSGSKVFYFFGRLNGKLERTKIGEYPRISLTQARREVKHMLGQAAIGKERVRVSPEREKRDRVAEVRCPAPCCTADDRRPVIYG